MFDLVDGGIVATFRDGPKQGNVGVVDAQVGDGPPKALHFMDGSLTYVRERSPVKITVADHTTGRDRRVTGVRYRVDRTCSFMRQAEAIVAEAQMEMAQKRIETL